MIPLTGLWLNQDKNGKKYMTGNISKTMKLLIFPNQNKREGSNDPTHIAYLAPIEVKKEEKPKDEPLEF